MTGTKKSANFRKKGHTPPPPLRTELKVLIMVLINALIKVWLVLPCSIDPSILDTQMPRVSLLSKLLYTLIFLNPSLGQSMQALQLYPKSVYLFTWLIMIGESSDPCCTNGISLSYLEV